MDKALLFPGFVALTPGMMPDATQTAPQWHQVVKLQKCCIYLFIILSCNQVYQRAKWATAPEALCSLCQTLCGSRLIGHVSGNVVYSSFLQYFGEPALHFSDVSLLQHTWFKWMVHHQASAELDDELIFWIRRQNQDQRMLLKGIFGALLPNLI